MQRKITAQDYYNAGIRYHQQKQRELAIQAYLNAINLNSGFAKAHSNLGVVYYELWLFEPAIYHHTQAIKLNPGLYQAFYNRAITYQCQNKHDLAIDNYLHAYKLNQKNTYINEKLNLLITQLSKQELFNIIKTFPVIRQIELRCLDQHSIVGKKFWENEKQGDMEIICNLESGILLEIKNHITDLIMPIARWVYLLGPELVEMNIISQDLILVIASQWLQHDISMLNTTPMVENFQMEMFPKNNKRERENSQPEATADELVKKPRTK